jgi:hypothetical protein
MEPKFVIYGDFDDFEKGTFFFVVKKESEVKKGLFVRTDTPVEEAEKSAEEIAVLHDCYHHWMAPDFREWWQVTFHWPGEEIPRKPTSAQIEEAKKPL